MSTVKFFRQEISLEVIFRKVYNEKNSLYFRIVSGG